MKMIYEILDETKRAPDRIDKVKILAFNNCFALRMYLQATYDPRIQFVFTELPPYKPSVVPPGLGQMSLEQELRNTYLFQTNNSRVSADLSFNRKQQLFIQALEALEAKEAEVYGNMILKKPVEGIDTELVLHAFPNLF